MQPSSTSLPRPQPAGTSSLLRNTLRADAAICAVVGVDLLAFSGLAGELLGLRQTGIPAVIGAALLAYAVFLFTTSRREPLSLQVAWALATADLAWVAGSAALIAFGPLSPTGNWIVGAVAVVTLAMAELKMLGIRRIRRAAPRLALRHEAA
jgi:hypothetical protein